MCCSKVWKVSKLFFRLRVPVPSKGRTFLPRVNKHTSTASSERKALFLLHRISDTQRVAPMSGALPRQCAGCSRLVDLRCHPASHGFFHRIYNCLLPMLLNLETVERHNNTPPGADRRVSPLRRALVPIFCVHCSTPSHRVCTPPVRHRVFGITPRPAAAAAAARAPPRATPPGSGFAATRPAAAPRARRPCREECRPTSANLAECMTR